MLCTLVLSFIDVFNSGTSDGESGELLALNDHMSSILMLCARTVDRVFFATKLKEKNFLDSTAVDAALYTLGITPMDSVRRLMDAVEAQIKVDRKRFEDFLDILRSFPPLETLAEPMKKCCGKYFYLITRLQCVITTNNVTLDSHK